MPYRCTLNEKSQMKSNNTIERAPTSRRRHTRKITAWTLSAIAVVAAASFAALWLKISTYVDPWQQKVAAAGYVEKTARVNDITLSYSEGPDNGPPLVLLHAQFLDWFSYSRVLPVLAKSFHVYDIDYPGHGRTVTPSDYPMTANRIGTDLGDFIEKHIGKPVFITGNSSGGLLAVWLAANRPNIVKAALLEDPPLFSSEYPQIKRTIAYRAFETSYKGARAHTRDFLLYWIHGNAKFFERNVGKGTPFLLTEAVKIYRANNPGQSAQIGLISNDTIRLLVRGLDEYDPRFGAAFYDGTWNTGFDHAAALRKIDCPVLLVQANYAFLADGTLDGAMSKDEADRAVSLLQNGRYLKVDATHVVNLDKPELFSQLIRSFFLHE